MEKALWREWNIPPLFIAAMETAWFYERLFFKVVMALVKEEKLQYKNTISIKISFMHYIK